MAESSTDFRIGQLTGEVGRLADEVAGIRQDGRERESRIIESIGQHDKRDDERFAGVGARLTTLERQRGIEDATAAVAERAQGRQHARQIAMHAALIGLVAAIIGGLVAGLAPLFFHFGGH